MCKHYMIKLDIISLTLIIKQTKLMIVYANASQESKIILKITHAQMNVTQITHGSTALASRNV